MDIVCGILMENLCFKWCVYLGAFLTACTQCRTWWPPPTPPLTSCPPTSRSSTRTRGWCPKTQSNPAFLSLFLLHHLLRGHVLAWFSGPGGGGGGGRAARVSCPACSGREPRSCASTSSSNGSEKNCCCDCICVLFNVLANRFALSINKLQWSFLLSFDYERVVPLPLSFSLSLYLSIYLSISVLFWTR